MENKMKISNFEKERRKKLENLKKLGHDPLSLRFKPKHKLNYLKEKYSNLSSEEMLKIDELFSVSGRLMISRNQGKAGFLVIKGEGHRLQLYFKKSEMSDESFEILKNSDIGDVIGVVGTLMKSSTNELTLRIKSFYNLAKSLLPLPNKHHGLKEVDDIYRMRYLDLIINDDSYNKFLLRTKIIKRIKDFLNEKGYIEFETPILTSVSTGASAKPFLTHHNSLNQDFKLRIATELFLKRLVVGGYEKVFEIGRIFRNEGLSTKHNPEFTMLEAYLGYGDYNDMMDLVENMIKEVVAFTQKKKIINYQNLKIDFSKPFKKIEMAEIVRKETGIDFKKEKTEKEIEEIVKKFKLNLKEFEKKSGIVLNIMFEKFCEEKLIQPTFITGYPIEVSPLAKRKDGSDMFTDRFELFINGSEYANGYSELNDPDEQEKRFVKQLEQKKQGNDEASEIDYDYINALKYGLIPTGGLGLGIDRLVMLFTDSNTIKNVILFPHNRKKKK